MRNSLFMTELVARLKRDGIAETMRKAVRYMSGRAKNGDDFDKIREVETSQFEPVWKLKVNGKNASAAKRYEPVTDADFCHGLSAFHGDRAETTFVDLGCGKGRALILAAEAGFGNVEGVEFSSVLSSIARKNILKLRIANASILTGDAAEYQFTRPHILLFMFNPFDASVMRVVAENIVKSGDFSPDYIHYCNPACARQLDGLPQYRRVISDSRVAAWQKIQFESKNSEKIEYK